MKRFLCLILAALTLGGCAAGGLQPAGRDPPGDRLAQLRADCDDEALAPEFDMIRSRIPMSQAAVTPAAYMLASMDIPTPAARLEIARLSEIRDRCTARVIAMIDVPPDGLPQPLWPMWPQVVVILQQDAATQHDLMMALAAGEMPYGPFVSASWQMAARRDAALTPFLAEAAVLQNVAPVEVASAGGDWEAVGELMGGVLKGFVEAAGSSGGGHHAYARRR
jgi:hypothetical protein